MQSSLKTSFARPQFLLVMIAIFGLVGCSDTERPIYPVRGIVRFPDGKVLRDGSVEFEIIGVEKPVTATGKVQPDGSFVLGTYQRDDGALVGKHRVVVVSNNNSGSLHERPGFVQESVLHEKYRSYRSSGLTYEVKPETNNFVIEVDYADTKP